MKKQFVNRSEMLNCVEKLNLPIIILLGFTTIQSKKCSGNSIIISQQVVYICIRTFEETWTYQDLYEKANQIAHVLVDDLGLQSGNRVLIRSANNPMMVACWFAVLKAGGIVVATMPLLRSKELTTVLLIAPKFLTPFAIAI